MELFDPTPGYHGGCILFHFSGGPVLNFCKCIYYCSTTPHIKNTINNYKIMISHLQCTWC